MSDPIPDVEDVCCVYRIVCSVNGKCYVGQTRHSKNRKLQHFRKLKKNEHGNPHLQSAYNKYGASAFYFEVLEDGLSPDGICEREVWWIAHFDSYHNGFNMTLGGDDRSGIIKPCAWNGVEYPSQKAAAKAVGITTHAMHSRLIRGYTCDADMPRDKPTIWNGILYPTITEASKAIGVSKESLSKWLRNGWTCDLDRATVLWNRIPYLNIAEAARANGVSFECMRDRLSRGYTCDDDVGGTGGGLKITWNGVVYPSISAAAKATGKRIAIMHKYIRAGYTSDTDVQAAPPRILVKAGKPVMWNGIRYRSIAAAARALGVTDSTLRDRLKRGHTCDADVGTEIPTIWNGIEYPSIKKAAEAAGVSDDVMGDRLKHGYRDDSELVSRRKKVVWNGIEYPSAYAAAKALNIPYMTLVQRLKRGWTCDDEVTIPSTKPWSSQSSPLKRRS